ncbi:MAG: hypothetical protein ACYTCU_07590 [Planctomycetota bacterium]
MTGPRILVAVIAVGALLLWAALAGDEGADLQRGLDQTEEAFAAVDDKLAALDPDYQTLLGQGLALGMRATHDQIRSGLASLRSARVAIRDDPTLDKRERLPRLRELVNSADQLLALATNLHLTVTTLVAFRKEALPLLNATRDQAERLEQMDPADDEQATRIAALASSLTETHQKVLMSEQYIRQDIEQGAQLGRQALTALRTIDEEQRKLLGGTP